MSSTFSILPEKNNQSGLFGSSKPIPPLFFYPWEGAVEIYAPFL